MAGGSKSYFRKSHALQISGTYTVTHPDWGTAMTVVPQFVYNPGDYPVSHENGLCLSRANSNAEYFAQEGSGGALNSTTGQFEGGTCDAGQPGGGPEREMGGAQENHPPFTSASGYHDCS